MAMNGTRTLPVVDTASTAWNKVSGAKGSIWGAIGISILISFFIGIISGVLNNAPAAVHVIIELIGQLISMLLQMGLIYIGIQRAKDKPINFKQVFHAFDAYVAMGVFGVYIIQFLIYLAITVVFVFIPMVLVGPTLFSTIQSGISLSSILIVSWMLIGFLITFYAILRMMLSIGFVLDSNTDSWSAIKMSVAATKGQVLSLLGLVLIQLLAFIAGAITLGIGLIWVLPFEFILFGTIYKRLTGVK